MQFFKDHAEILTIVGSIAGGMTTAFTIFLWLVRFYTKSLKKENADLKRSKAELESRGDELKKERNRAAKELQSLKPQYECLRNELDALKEKKRDREQQFKDAAEKWKADQRAKVEGLNAQIRHLKQVAAETDHERIESIADLNQQIDTLQISADHLNTIKRRIEELSSNDGRLWVRPLLPSTPAFRPRQTPIISVLNLKGGVGKTTISANLAGMLGKQGKRVLLLDLDFQRSLSQLILTNHERKLRHSQKRCLQHFLAHKTHDLTTLRKLIGAPLRLMPNCWILPNSDDLGESPLNAESRMDDSLEETEMRLMIDWIFQPKPADIRFFLREALHGAGMESHFDYVIMDCPPRLTTASINALAASDYVLIPVELDRLSASSVPNLHRVLKSLMSTVFPDLKILGVVANQVTFTGGALTQEKRLVWDGLGEASWQPDMPFFKTMIPARASFGTKANISIGDEKLKLAITDPALHDVFEKLVSEIYEKIESNVAEAAKTLSA